jgi:hypothetical protein
MVCRKDKQNRDVRDEIIGGIDIWAHDVPFPKVPELQDYKLVRPQKLDKQTEAATAAGSVSSPSNGDPPMDGLIVLQVSFTRQSSNSSPRAIS